MGAFMANWKGQKAAKLQSKGQIEEARKMYAEAVAGGMTDPRLLLAYSVLLIRAEAYQEAKDLLVKTQKAPALNAEQKQQRQQKQYDCTEAQAELALQGSTRGRWG